MAYDRTDVRLIEVVDHRLLRALITHADAADTDLLHKDSRQQNFIHGGATQYTDQSDMAAHFCSAHGFPKGVASADFYDVIDALIIGCREHRFAPLRLGSVID